MSSTLSSQSLQKPLQPCYVISGDEILLHVEACDALRAAAIQQGYTERHRFVMDGRSDWSAVFEVCQALSLFGDKRFIDISIPAGKPGRSGSDALNRLSSQFSSTGDNVFLIQLPRLDRATRNAKWAKQLESTSQWVDIPSIDKKQLPQWLQQRTQSQKQRLHPEALLWLADQVEGNLLAAHQEIQKMGLLYPEGELSLLQVQAAVLNVARYNVFDLRDAMLNGDAKRALTVLHGLRGEGEALPLVLWAIGDEIRILAALSAIQQSGGDLNQAFREQRVFGAREKQLRHCLQRLSASIWPPAVRHAHEVDRLIKGLKNPGGMDDPWEEAARLCLRIALAA
ncbi:DNA polymerase III subunit delta [Paenalcaligenes faecalis]|uniref:DNA polymerase III subunit delta n=1 Tax=Paenalcaligenes faecalis TaxID=2980099 RepID=UPI0022B968F5|nr:DNA polymerase III subunit delta [Paenalcaligenes faecalis]